jgi:uncharacterized membrane protein
MNKIVETIVHDFKQTPFLLAVLLINTLVLVGFVFTLIQVSEAVERRDKILERCIK